eukprot:m.174181 g.174181  ORF g.174181 m.174181 type:complete len:123 (+) comp16751_c0_seq10:2681-3049(+)
MALHRALILFSTLEVTLLAQSVPRLVASLEAVSKLTSPNFLLQVIDVNRDAEVKVRETILGDLRRELATVVVYCLGDAALAVQDVVRSNLRRVYNALMHACDLCFFLPLLCYGCCLMRSCML